MRDLTDAEIRAERSRTIEQATRLYAVVMGYSVVNLFNNLYACAKQIGIDFSGLFVLGMYVLVFNSLASLFYFGTARAIDMQYLKPWSKLPGKFGFFFDFLWLGSSAAMFVVLSDMFPDPQKVQSAKELIDNQHRFCVFLLIIYMFDTIVLVVNLLRMVADKMNTDDDRIHSSLWWILLNIGAGLIIYSSMDMYKRPAIEIQIGESVVQFNQLTLILLITHFVRFFLDFLFTFRLYYPPYKLHDDKG